MSDDRREPVRFSFPRPDSRGLLLGLRPPQIGLIAVAVLTATATVTVIPSGVGLLLAVIVVGLGGAAAFARVRGRTVDQWAPALAAWCAPWRARRRRWTSSLPQRGEVAGEPPAADPPPPLENMRLLRVTGGPPNTAVAVVKDTKLGTYTAVVACCGRAFGLLDPSEQHRLAGLWGQALAALCQEHSPVTRVGWVARSRPDSNGELERFLHQRAVLPADHPARVAYADLVAAATPGRRHELFLTLTIGGERSRRAIRHAGGGEEGACQVLLRELDTLTTRLAQVEIDTRRALAPHQVVAVLREAFDPRSASRLGQDRPAPSTDEPRLRGRDAWPLATQTAWDHYRSDSGVHATYWVADWPRRDVTAEFLQPLLLHTVGAASAVAVIMEPVPPSRATRGAESAHASHLADEELRAKVGYLSTARRRQEHEAILAREAELAAGHGEMRFSGYVTVTTATPEALEPAAMAIEEAGYDAQLELRRLYGEQDQAFTHTLPLGRGLADRRPSPRAVHRATTATVQALYPFVATPGLGDDAPYVGPELYGGAFCYDPWTLYAKRHLTNPNILVAGKVGRGKSSLVKSLLLRSAVFGRRAAVLDPKGEYGPLAAALGVEPIRLRPGSGIRLNPLDAGPATADVDPDEIGRRRLGLLQSVAATALRRDLLPIERAACHVALDAATTASAASPTLPMVVEALLEPSRAAVAALHTTTDDLAHAGRDVALELRRLCDGDLRGMFDGPTTIDVDWDGPLVVIDFSHLHDDDGLAILMACATTWIQAAVMRPGGARYLVLDEAWRLLSHLGTARWLRASLKLARQYGVANVLVLHRLSDLLAAGDADSEQVQLARGLLSDTETRIVYAQAESELGDTATLLGLTNTERDTIAALPRGVALWHVGQTRHVVAHQLGQAETAIVDTDAGMTGNQVAA
ncbi:MAG: SCO6880 family protein [Acidimicrobiia bacterium]